MLHIKNSSNSPPSASTMCNRRHKGMLQTSIILVLFVCIGYGFYLYNLLQVRIKYLDSKVLRHQSQHQSLTSRLQAVYEERAKLENKVQESKIQLQKTLDEKEAVVQEMLIEHQDKNEELAKKNTELKDKNKALDVEKHDLKQKYDKISREHDALNKKHQSHLNEHASQISDVRAEVEMYQRNNLNLQREKQDMEEQARQSNDQYEEIKHALNAIPANAVNFDHPAVAKLPLGSKQLLKTHLGEPDDFQPQLVVDSARQRDNNAEQMVQQQLQGDVGQVGQFQNQAPQQQENDARRLEYEERRREYEAQQQNQQAAQQEADQRNVVNGFDNPQQPAAGFPNQDHISPQMPVQNIAPVAQTIDICALVVDSGPCHDPGKMRFAYFPQLKQCRGFTYGGCGGNQNNFESMDQCTEVCNDPRRRYIEMSLTEEQQVQEMVDQGIITNDESIQHVVGKPVEEEEEQRDKGLDEEQRKLTLEREMNAQRDEEQARRELEEQNQNNNGGQAGNEDEDPLNKLKENSIKQLEVAKNQQADMQKLLEQQQKDDESQPDDVVDNVEAKIEDDGKNSKEDYDTNEDNQEEEDPDEEEEEIEDGGELELAEARRREEGDSQFDMPPAAKIAGHDPEAVMDAPPADHGIDSKDINGRDIYEQERQEEDDLDDPNQPLEYKGDNQQDEGGEEDEGEEEDDDFNQNDPRDDGFGQDDGGRPDFEDPDQGNEDENEEEDNYGNEEEDAKEKELRESREEQRIVRDRQFKARREVQGMLPPGADLGRNREM